MEQVKCKWLSDDFSEICTNADCDYRADYCPCTKYPNVCRYSELAEENKDELEDKRRE